MVNRALLARVDELDTDELDELIEYAASKRIGAVDLTIEQRAALHARRSDNEPANWLSDDEVDRRLDSTS